jgi:hypothetical protein
LGALAILSCSLLAKERGAPPVVTEMASDVSPAPDIFSVVELIPPQGDLNALLTVHAERAAELDRRPFVEFTAEWCPSCVLLEQSLEDERMTEAFRGIYIIRLDIDEWKSRLARTDFIVVGVPAFFEVDGDGQPTGRTLTGAAWGPDVPENMAPVLQEFFQTAGG